MNERCLDGRPNPLHNHGVAPRPSIHTSGSSAQASSSNPISEVFVDPRCASRYILPRPQGASPLPHLSGHQQQQQQQQQPRVSFMEEVVISSGGVNQINQPSQQHQRASYPAPATGAREQRPRHVRSNSQHIGVFELSELEQMALAKHEQNKELYQMVHDAAMRNWREREASRDQSGNNN
ncbi:hypothetical protein HDU80_008348 [Chytriomyces hyalinus]|nr:hypothetical protein HDU80_008348 [Chytriomyces hyalinus]